MKKVWFRVVAAVGAVAAAVAGVVLLVLTGQRKTPPTLPTPERPDTPPVDKPLVTLKPSTDYEASKVTSTNGTPPNVVITNINQRHK